MVHIFFCEKVVHIMLIVRVFSTVIDDVKYVTQHEEGGAFNSRQAPSSISAGGGRQKPKKGCKGGA